MHECSHALIVGSRGVGCDPTDNLPLGVCVPCGVASRLELIGRSGRREEGEETKIRCLPIRRRKSFKRNRSNVATDVL